jgi:hypothetical protein
MEFLFWVKVTLAVALAAIGLLALIAWALLRQVDKDEDYWS